jgi:hypothetical protein
LHTAALLHPALLGRCGQTCLSGFARAGLLPMRGLYHLLH